MATYDVMSDVQLVNLFKEGDERAYAEIYDHYKGPLYIPHAFNLLRDREEPKEILQQVFINLWTNRGRLEVRAQFAGYLLPW